jgi:rubrerythrin
MYIYKEHENGFIIYRRSKMDIYEYALQMEKDGEHYYRELESKTVNKGLKTIFDMLAEAEVKHRKLFENMKINNKVHMTETTILNDVKNIFVLMKEEKQTNVNVSEMELYKKAQDIEQRSRDFYLEKANLVDQSQKEIFMKIADEEKRHYFILEKIIDFVNRPSYWLENPEWYHLEDY